MTMTANPGAAAPRSTTALLVWVFVALLLGLCGGWVDLHNDEVQAAALVIIVSAFLVAAAAGEKPWLFGLATGLGIFFTYAARLVFGMPPREEVRLAETLVAIIPGMIGAFAGYVARRLLSAAMRAL